MLRILRELTVTFRLWKGCDASNIDWSRIVVWFIVVEFSAIVESFCTVELLSFAMAGLCTVLLAPFSLPDLCDSLLELEASACSADPGLCT